MIEHLSSNIPLHLPGFEDKFRFYIYSMKQLYAKYPLDPAKEHIRLFHIEPLPWDAELTGTFSVTSPSENPNFVALSYTWGEYSVVDRLTVRIQDCQVPISKNLYAGLRCLRWHAYQEEQTKSLTVWADALCISQEDLTEKQHQIPLMRKIYSRCEFTAIWLGELSVPGMLTSLPFSESTNSSLNPVEVAIRLIENLYQGQHLTSIEPFDRDDTNALFVCVQRIFYSWSVNPWFTRRWVLQEVVLASDVKVYFGEVLMKLETLSHAMDMYAWHIEKSCCTTSNPGHYMLRRYIRGFLQEFTSIRHFRNSKDREAHILELCKEFASRETSLEADYVYALLSLTSPPSTIVPDYTLPIHSLLTDVCIDYVNKNHSLKFLHLACSDGLREMPSWVIDWTEAEKSWAWVAELFCSTATLSQSPEIYDRSFLRIIAYPVDEIDSIARFSARGNITDVLKTTKENFLGDICFNTYPTGGTWAEAWIRTLSADSCWGANSARRLTPEDYKFYLNAISNEHAYSPYERVTLAGGRQVLADAHLNDIMRMVAMIQDERVLFSTKRGYIGVADEVVELGDRVYLVPGSSMPVIMRDVDRRIGLQIVGACYLHGWMDGVVAIAPVDFVKVDVA